MTEIARFRCGFDGRLLVSIYETSEADRFRLEVRTKRSGDDGWAPYEHVPLTWNPFEPPPRGFFPLFCDRDPAHHFVLKNADLAAVISEYRRTGEVVERVLGEHSVWREEILAPVERPACMVNDR